MTVPCRDREGLEPLLDDSAVFSWAVANTNRPPTVIDQMLELGVGTLSLEGGEPLLRYDDLLAALDHAAAHEAHAEAEALRAQNNELEDQLYDLQIENRKLADLVAGLEAQVEAVNADDTSATPVLMRMRSVSEMP